MVPKNKIAILVFHPLLHKSRVNSLLVNAVKELPGVNPRIMYDLYPDFAIDVKEEQEVLLNHDIIIWQHPLYWYSSPSLLKEWTDLVLEHGFAYGREGRALEGKKVMSVISAGGRRNNYGSVEGVKFSIRQLLAPFEQTVSLCRMDYLPPFVTHGTHLMNREQIEKTAETYASVIQGLLEDSFREEELLQKEYINDIIL
ncbi:MAG: NAD(P)H-dependent oxidoreductase [Bacteroidales bacterium]|nr:NAD(P)H-dependent oxidoreductase [Bacteroidales bacterium]